MNELASPTWTELTGAGLFEEVIGAVSDAHRPYAAAVAKFEQVDKLSWDRVKELDLANHRRLCVLIGALVARFAEDGEARKNLLAPVARQDQEVFEALRARRKVLDVDPTTGDPIAPVVPTPDEPPPA